jgi:hypothetical protein
VWLQDQSVVFRWLHQRFHKQQATSLYPLGNGSMDFITNPPLPIMLTTTQKGIEAPLGTPKT